MDVNEAVLLGPRGQDLSFHRKMTSFTDYDAESGVIGEKLRTGKVISIVESPIGNLCPLICLDLFHQAILPIHGPASLTWGRSARCNFRTWSCWCIT